MRVGCKPETSLHKPFNTMRKRQSNVAVRPSKTTDNISSDLNLVTLPSVESTEELKGYEFEIRTLLKQTLENVVRLGEIFTKVKEILPHGSFSAWREETFGNDISEDTVKNFMNAYELHAQYKDKYPEGLENLSLNSLYKLGTQTVSSDVREAVLEMAQENPVSTKDTNRIIQTYRKIQLQGAGLEPNVIRLLAKTPIGQDPKQLQELKSFSKSKQLEVAKIIAAGDAETPKEALRIIKQVKAEEANETSSEAIAVEYTEMALRIHQSLQDLMDESVNLAIVEAPLRYDFVEQELPSLSKELARVLAPGGHVIITVGHKAAMFVGDALTDLKPAHLLCLRRQPGNTRNIIGLNIASASVFAAFAYKPPYKAPKGLLVDLQTITDTEAYTGMDEVQSGLEKSFEYFMTPLVEPGDTVLHQIIGQDHFSIRESLILTANNLKAATFLGIR